MIVGWVACPTPSEHWREPRAWKRMLARSKRGFMARLPKGIVRPREAVLKMAPYSPPTAGREGKLRLDFNENTVGCSPRVIEFLKARLSADRLAVYPEYSAARPALAEFFHVDPDQLLLTNGTDEAIQVLVNT